MRHSTIATVWALTLVIAGCSLTLEPEKSFEYKDPAGYAILCRKGDRTLTIDPEVLKTAFVTPSSTHKTGQGESAAKAQSALDEYGAFLKLCNEFLG